MGQVTTLDLEMGGVEYQVEKSPFRTITPLTSVELMQYTGLKDSKGVEIYEGDIVKFGSIDSMPYKGSVEMRNGCWTAKINDRQNMILAQHILEVIGNLYMNPELIK